MSDSSSNEAGAKGIDKSEKDDSMDTSATRNKSESLQNEESTEDNVIVSQGKIELGESLDLQNIENLHDKLKQSLSDSNDTEVNVGQIESIDTAALQLLLAFSNDLRSKGKKLNWIGQSDEFNESIALLNLSSHIDIDPGVSTEEELDLCPVL